MVKIVNPYTKAYDFLAKSKWRKSYRLDRFLLPALKLQSSAFRDGGLTQLMACIADLRIWASQFRALGKEEIAKELDQFAKDWKNEWPV